LLNVSKDLSYVRHELKSRFVRSHKLGVFNAVPVFCAELPANFALPQPLENVPLRNALHRLGENWYGMLTKAFSIINWDRNHQYCGRCGNLTVQHTVNFERTCEHCKLNFYPRISPSIIALIHRDDEILMARGHQFQPGIYGLIAGFVEAGESLEDAIHREIHEETALRVRNLRYFGSQAWPFPDSLMVGFFAEYASGTLKIDNVEIEDAGWYRFDALPGRPSTNISISSRMLDHYIAEHRKTRA
jgi:NAD+ diphosphatase